PRIGHQSITGPHIDTQRQTTSHTHTHSYGQFRVTNQPDIHVFGLCSSFTPVDLFLHLLIKHTQCRQSTHTRKRGRETSRSGRAIPPPHGSIRPQQIANSFYCVLCLFFLVCYPNGSNFQCRCEGQYVWSYRNCIIYGACDEIIDDTCTCINSIPYDGQYCQPKTVHPVVYEYQIFIEVNTTDADQLRNTLKRSMFPVQIGAQISISSADITTVCRQSDTGFQCRCEDEYIWPCEKCATYEKCDSNTNNTCKCIKAIPTDGQYCQSSHHQSEYCSPPALYEYLISIELTISDVAVINELRTILSNISYPISINNHTQISDLNISTVCSPSSGGYQCRCEDQYRWSCDQCLTFGASCDNIMNNTCGCINTIPPDGQYCQSVYQHNFTACPVTTLSPAPTCKKMYSESSGHAQHSFGVEMSVTLGIEFTAELNDATSPRYKELKSKIYPVVKNQYRRITGFISVSINGFRKGSVITDFVVETTQVNSNEIAEANQKLPEVMKPIAPVIGSVSAVYMSPTPISFPNLTYTGDSMMLKCGPPPVNIHVGHISGSVWKFKGLEIKAGGRIKINNTGNVSVLTVNNIIAADTGFYECTLKGRVMDFLQNGTVRENQIKQAPIVQLQSQINIQCKEGQIQPLECCVQKPYTVQWFQGTTVLISDPTNGTENYCIKYNYSTKSCSTSQDKTISFICRVNQPHGYEMTMTLTIFNSGKTAQCNNNGTGYGIGRANDTSVIGCDKGQEGNKTATCQETGEWRLVRDTCIITTIKELLIESQDLNVEEVPHFVVALSQAVQKDKSEIKNSSGTISAIVNILNTISNVSTAVNFTVMQNVIHTVDVIIGNDTKESWAILNANTTYNASSELLGSMETLSDELVGEFNIKTERILLNRTMFSNSFHADLNSNIIIDIPNTGITNTFITTITFSTLNNVMPVRNSAFNVTNKGTAINAAVVLVKINATIQNITLSYNKVNKSLTMNPQCVFWNFTLLQNLGAWDDRGCNFVSDINNTVTCSCNHLTSFSLLMATDIPPSLTEALDIITYVGVGISLASLVICLIIEGYVWKAVTRNSTAFMRHVSIVNTALSLLIADICFIIAAAIANNPLENQGKDLTLPVGPCSTATFFMHFFYLALFFWMLVSGLLLFYRTVMVFSHMSKSTMLAIGFSLGYGCPLIIAAITVAVTAPGHGYIRKTDGCWLNWSETKALLALVIPALTIVFINILIVIVVLFKMLRRGVGDITQRDERHTLVVVARCVIILTPLFGLTWSLGVGTMVSSTNKGIHIAFAFFNSLQVFTLIEIQGCYNETVSALLKIKKYACLSSGLLHISVWDTF
uniref:Adhesion G protein-coupled receptor F5 n=1 Tax=Mastacembelus armatus TaxID=205130 RepID=A0A3Q3RSD3_9TELE